MDRCPESERIEPWLDRELGPEGARAFERHLAGCARCAAERRAIESLYARLRGLPPWEPGPDLTERILDRVLPSRVWRRHVTILGWCYSTVTAVTTFAFISWIVRPETHVWLGRLLSTAGGRVIDSGLLVLDGLLALGLQLQRGWGLLEVLGGWLMPVARALGSLASDPSVGAALWAAVAASAALLWWMGPRPIRWVRGRNRHVGLLAF